MESKKPVDHPISLPGYRITEKICTIDNTLVCRGIKFSTEGKAKEEQPVVLKLLLADCPTSRELLQFRNQYTITRSLDISGVIRPYSLEVCGNSYALIMEDFGGVSLQQYTQNHALSLPEVLEIALQLVNILHELNQHQIIHKDIKPGNILIHPKSRQIQLIDFSIASLLPKETQEIQNPQVLEGTLAYISPEQTGQVNRGVDYRTDFYSLGVTIYELLTGQLPFQAKDPIELMHCHIAHVPASPWEIGLRSQGRTESESEGKVTSELPESLAIRPLVPKIISDIVMKLMAKNAEDRYQTALGLKHDLEKFLNQWKETDGVHPAASFELGEQDVRDRFLIPEKLYGREKEIQMLLETFERVSDKHAQEEKGIEDNKEASSSSFLSSSLYKQSELFLLTGFSGIGKTAVVNEIYKPINRQHGYFIRGKFGQFNRNSPFSAFVQAFRSLIWQLLGESDSELARWRSKILEITGSSGQVLIEVIPELVHIIGEQPSVPELLGTAAQNRFNLLFSKFVQVFATKNHPLVIFLDDLQWADLASLDLLKLLVTETSGYLLVLGAYRHSEVPSAHPLMLALNEIRTRKTNLTIVALEPLSETDINQLIADTLQSSIQLTKPLAQLVYQKTKGNPFFTTQFLQGLYEEGSIWFEPTEGYWRCDLAKVKRQALTNDVVEFMVGRLRKLPEATQDVLKLAACVNNWFDLTTLAVICEQDPKIVAASLWHSLESYFVIPETETYKFFQNADPVPQVVKSGADTTVRYRFLHDRIQQAAYQLVPSAERAETHLKLGKLLLGNTLTEGSRDHIFNVVNQMNQSIDLINSPREKYQLAQLNFRAGRKAKAATAYAAAAEYAALSQQLLVESLDNSWQTEYEFTLALYELAIETAYLTGNFPAVNTFRKEILTYTVDELDQVKTYEVWLQVLIAQNRILDAIHVGLEYLTILGINLPEDPDETAVEQAVQAICEKIPFDRLESLAVLPRMSEPRQLAAIRILSGLLNAAYLGSPKLLPLLVVKQVDLSITHGTMDASPSAYANLGLILCGIFGEIDSGYCLGDLALSLLSGIDSKAFYAKTLEIVYLSVKHWKAHIKSTLKPLLEGYTVGLEVGDFESASFAAYDYCAHSFVLGHDLVLLEQEMRNYSTIINEFQQTMVFNLNEIHRQTILNLIQRNSGNPARLKGEAYDEDQMLPVHQQDNDFSSLALLHIDKLFLAYLLGDSRQAVDIAAQAELYLEGIPGQVFVPIFYFYDALSWLALYASLDKEEQEGAIARIFSHQAKLSKWADFAPMNYAHKLSLLQAETHRVLGGKAEAIEQYDRAIAGAKEYGYIHEEAIASELAAKFYLDWGKEKVAASYLQEAYYGYARWGAKAKTDALERHYSSLLYPVLQQSGPMLNPLNTLKTLTPKLSIQTSTKARPSENSITLALDFAAILRASQTLTSTIQLDELLRQLTQTILQYSGGDRCALILPSLSGDWQIRAFATPNTTELCNEPLESTNRVPIQLIRYVKNIKEVVVVDDLNTDLPVLDSYLHEHQPKSVLGLPIFNQGAVVGLLYLSNQSISRVFTNNHILILNFLCTQAAVSLENARLYRLEQAKAKELEALNRSLSFTQFSVEHAADGIFWINPDASFFYANQAVCAMSGYSVSELTARSVFDLDIDMSREQWVSHWEDIKARKSFILESRHQSKDGRIYPVEITVNYLKFEDREYNFVRVRDISDRKRMESEINLNKARLTASFEQAAVGFAESDMNTGRLTLTNTHICSMTGYTKAELLGMTVADLTHPEDIAAFKQELQRLASGQIDNFTVEKRYVRKDGTFFWAETTVYLVTIPGRKNTFCMALIQDISERKQLDMERRAVAFKLKQREAILKNQAVALAELSQSPAIIQGNIEQAFCAITEQTARVLQVSRVSVWLLDPSGAELRCLDLFDSQAQRHLSGQVLMVESYPAYLTALHRESIFAVEDACTDTRTCELAETYLIPSGITSMLSSRLGSQTCAMGAICIEVVGKSHRWQTAEENFARSVANLVTLAIEVNNRQRQAQTLEQALEDLQRTQLQLIQSEKMSSIGQLVAGIAHEINNPVGFIYGNLTYAEQYVNDLLGLIEKYQQHYPAPPPSLATAIAELDLPFLQTDLVNLIQSMHLGTNRIQEIIKSLRTFSRLDEAEVKDVNLHENIDSTLLILRTRLRAQNWRPEIQVIKNYGDLPLFQCHAGQLNQVFMNVLSNAIEALEDRDRQRTMVEMENCPSTIRIQTEILTQSDKSMICLKITDNGPGMDRATLSRLFVPFFTTKPVGRGTGLGLSISYQIITQKHGGNLICESRLGEGTTFTITLPL